MKDINLEVKEQSVDYKAIFYKIFANWYIFVLTIFLALILAFIVNKYTKPIYEIKTTVLIKDKSENKLNPEDIIGFGIGNKQQNLQNEIGVLSSYSLTYRAVTKVGFEVSYFSEENFITKELYTKSPFTVVLDTTVPQPDNIRADLKILSNHQYRLEIKLENVGFYDYSKKEIIEGKKTKINYDEVLSFGKEIVTPNFKFKIVLNSNFDSKNDIGKSFYFSLKDYNSLVSEFKNYAIEPINKEASIVEIKLKGANVNKLADFLNALTREYLEKGLERKNLVAMKTIAFIDNELKGISDTLYSSERALQVFRTDKETMNLDTESGEVFKKMMDLQDEKAILQVKSKYLTSLKEYLEKNQNLGDLVVPSSMGVDDPILNDLTIKLTQLYSDRTENAQYSREKKSFPESTRSPDHHDQECTV